MLYKSLVRSVTDYGSFDIAENMKLRLTLKKQKFITQRTTNTKFTLIVKSKIDLLRYNNNVGEKLLQQNQEIQNYDKKKNVMKLNKRKNIIKSQNFLVKRNAIIESGEETNKITKYIRESRKDCRT